MKEIEDAVRTIARTLGKHTNQSLFIIVDPDGTFVYERVSPDFCRNALAVSVELGDMLMHRRKVRAKSIGTEKD